MEFFDDYSRLICDNKRYAGASGKKGHAYYEALREAGYATDPKYVELCDGIYRQLGCG